LHNVTEGLCLVNGVPAPTLLVIDDPSSNALVYGRGPKDARLVVTSGLLERNGAIELEGLLARELVQIKNGEMAHNTRVVGLVGLLAALADSGVRHRSAGTNDRDTTDGDTIDSDRGTSGGGLRTVLVVFAPLAGLAGALLRSLLDEGRDTLGDLAAVESTRYPPGLVGALETMTGGAARVATAGRATAHLWVAEPLTPIDDGGLGSRVWQQLETHEPLDARIAALREL
jgi:heat shock protein HtpX